MRALLVPLILVLLIMPGGLAVDWNDLPVRNVYDPRTRQNEPIRDYTFWELDGIMGDPRFQQWNDLDRVCDAMLIIYGRVGHACPQPAPQYGPGGLAPPHVRAYVPPGGAHISLAPIPRRPVRIGPPPWAYPPPRYPFHPMPYW